MSYTQEQFDKLPKWAQSEINSLKSNVSSLQKKVDEYSGTSETNTYLIDGLSKTPLPNRAHVEFNTEFGRVNVYVRRNGLVDINTDSRIGDMVIKPRAANSFYIDFIK